MSDTPVTEAPSTIWTTHIHAVLLCAVALVVLVNAYHFLVAKSYQFRVEGPCDPSAKNCYVRDCEASDCSADQQATYTVYSVPAKDFPLCANNTCSNLCATEAGPCTEIVCGTDAEDSCSATR